MPFAAIIPALAGLGGSIASSAMSSRAQRQAQERAMNDPLALAQRAQIEQQTRYGSEMGAIARRLFPQYEEGTNTLADYWKRFLGDSNEPAMEALAPQIRTRKNQTQSELSALDFAPRGGGRNEMFSRLYETEHGDILDMLGNERRDARGNYAALIGDIGNRAQNFYGGAAGVSANAASLLGAMADRNAAARRDAAYGSAQSSAALGQGLASILNAIMNRQNSSSSGGSPWTPSSAGGTSGQSNLPAWARDF